MIPPCSHPLTGFPAHLELALEGNILHRDINPLNLLYVPNKDTTFLIDLDFAAYIEPGTTIAPRDEKSPNKYTFALPFLPCDQINPKQDPALIRFSKHLYRHDLEGFFWTIWWIVIAALPQNPDERHEHDITCGPWRSPDQETSYRAKWGFIRGGYEDILPKLEGWSNPDAPLFYKFLTDITTLFDDGYRALNAKPLVAPETAGGFITIDNFLRQFPPAALNALPGKYKNYLGV